MITVHCRDMGTDCDHSVTAETPEQVKQEMMAHAMSAHGAELAAMSMPEKMELMKKLDALLSQGS